MRTIEERLFDVRNVVASQRLEGLETDAETITDMERVARGELTTAQAIERGKERLRRMFAPLSE